MSGGWDLTPHPENSPGPETVTGLVAPGQTDLFPLYLPARKKPSKL